MIAPILPAQTALHALADAIERLTGPEGYKFLECVRQFEVDQIWALSKYDFGAEIRASDATP